MKLTREKHLDHMVRVVPLIVLGYALQCWIISGMNTPIGSTSLMVLGGLLCSMIVGFITYDTKHQVSFDETSLTIEFLGLKKEIPYSEIHQVVITNPQHNFGSIMLNCKSGRHRLFFVDEVEKVTAFLEEKRHPKSEKIAA